MGFPFYVHLLYFVRTITGLFVRKILYISYSFMYLYQIPTHMGKQRGIHRIKYYLRFIFIILLVVFIIPFTNINILMRFRHAARNNECAENRGTSMVHWNRLQYDQFSQHMKVNIQLILTPPIQLRIYSLKDAVNSSAYTVLNAGWSLNDELEKMRKEAEVFCMIYCPIV
jgi:hypothetical protein